MLDKSVPFATLFMHRPAGTPIPEFPLPEGFRFVMFQDGDETDWARIETSVAEFDSEFEALMSFKKEYIPEVKELYRRLLFIETTDGKKVATANAWWSHVKCDRRAWIRSKKEKSTERRPFIHWVSVDPQYQGLGLGKAVTSRAMNILREIEGDVDMYLNTQTWSYKAIDIYRKCGFQPTDEAVLYDKKNKNDYAKAIKILSELKR